MATEQTPTGTSAGVVLAVVEWLQTKKVIYQINGGWAVDALVGRQTRPHRDVDVFLDATRMPAARRWLSEQGYSVESDQSPVRVELVRGQTRVDLHPMVIHSGGDGRQQGLGGAVFDHPAASRTVGRIRGRAVIVADTGQVSMRIEGPAPRVVPRGADGRMCG